MLKEALLTKYKKGQLSHFYVVSCPLSSHEASEFLETWINDLLANIIKIQRENITIEKAQEVLKLGHPDIQFINTENKSYTLKGEEFDDFFKFLNFNNHSLPRKFIVVWDAYKISEILANKLLKTLEEPPVDTTIFFVDPLKKEVLPTISSRAIHLNIPLDSLNDKDKSTQPRIESHSFANWWSKRNEKSYNESQEKIAEQLARLEQKSLNLYEFIDLIKAKSFSEDELLGLIYSWIRECGSDGQQIGIFLDQMAKIDDQKVYHGATQNRVIPLIEKLFL